MKSFRKWISVLCAVCMVLSVAVTAFAASEETSIEEYAYMDISTATPELRDKILAARCEFVYGDQAWTVNGIGCRILSDGTKVPLPEFSELFPEWDLREISAYAHAHTTNARISSGRNEAELLSSGISFSKAVNLPLASGSNWTGTMFYNFNGDGSPVYAYARTLPGDKYNIAIYDATDREDVSYVPNTSTGKDNGAYISSSSSSHQYEIRASAADKAGDAYMVVTTE